ncbi:MAG: hypothetical protein AAF245_11365, partial [Pseudomonadota bacterium]
MSLQDLLDPKGAAALTLARGETAAGKPLAGIAPLFAAVMGAQGDLVLDAPVLDRATGRLSGKTFSWGGTEATFALAFEGERITEVSLVQPVAGPSDPFDIGLHLDGLRKWAE